MKKAMLIGGAASVIALCTGGANAEVQSSAFNTGANSAAKAVAPEDRQDSQGEITVTATKSRQGTSVHATPLSVTAFSGAQLAKSHVQTLSDITNLAPNVYLNSSVAVPGFNNFSIRGMGVNSSVPSTTPTVGVFVDGIYVGANSGTALSDIFDVVGVEVLRGPQGLLFGRNVTAGAVLLRTSEPGRDLKISAQAGIESGLNQTYSALVSGPITQNGTLSAKIGVFYNNDDGYFHNLFDNNKHFGQSTTTIFRGALAWRPHDRFTSVLRFEDATVRGDGAAGQNHGVFSPNGFGFSVNETGYNNIDRKSVTSESRLDVAFGDGQITSLAGWREVKSRSKSDIDSTPRTDLHQDEGTRHEQFSEELRYAGRFGGVSTTVGGFYYRDKLKYIAQRDLAGGTLTTIGGGQQRSRQWAIFSTFDIQLPYDFTLNLGARYSKEHKRSRIDSLRAGNPCSFVDLTCQNYSFTGSKSWKAFTPKIGLEWTPTAQTHAYGFWTKGFRSGGFNLRALVPTIELKPYDQEVVNSYELGIKQYFLDRRLNINLAVFRNDYKNLQRDVQTQVPILGIVQRTQNTADTTITGIEGEISLKLVPGLTFGANGGYLHNKWKRFRVGLLSPTGAITPELFDLVPPFFARYSYGTSLDYVYNTTFGEISARVSYQHVDRTYGDDKNVYKLNPVNNVDANLTASFGDRISISVYGKNILNKTTFGYNNALPFSPGQTFAPLNKGRIIGAVARYNY